MKSLADGLPPEIARQIHPDWRKNEADYWGVRDSLLGQFRDQWVAFADGAVIATGKSPVEVFHLAQRSGRHPFVTCVGREDEPARMRRSSFGGSAPQGGEASGGVHPRRDKPGGSHTRSTTPQRDLTRHLDGTGPCQSVRSEERVTK
jgi:hypothetical protein